MLQEICPIAMVQLLNMGPGFLSRVQETCPTACVGLYLASCTVCSKQLQLNTLSVICLQKTFHAVMFTVA
jgi:hypothetical protein